MSRLSRPTQSDDRKFSLPIVIPLAASLLGLVVYPLTYSFWLSLHETEFAAQRFIFNWGANYIEAIQDPRVLHAFRISAQFAFEAILLSVGIGLGAALVLNESFKGRAFLRVAVLLPWAVSEYVTGVTWKWLFNDQFGFVNGLLQHLQLITKPINFLNPNLAIHIVAMALAWHIAPLAAFFILGGLQVIPEDLYKAAKVDGANVWKRFRFVQLPFLRYTLLIAFVISTLFSLTALDVVILLTGGGPGNATSTMTYLIYKETFLNINLGLGSAQSYLLLGFIILVAVMWFRLLTRR